MAPKVHPRDAARKGRVDQEVPCIVLGRAARSGRCPVDRAAVGEGLPELGGAVEDVDGTGGDGGGGGIGGPTPVHGDCGAGEGRRETLDGVNVEGEAAVGAEVTADVREGLLDWVPSPKGR